MVANQAPQVPVAPPPLTLASRARDFFWINLSEFYAEKLDEDPQAFINEVYRDLAFMEMTSDEKAELVTYQLKCLTQIWHAQWRLERGGDGPIR